MGYPPFSPSVSPCILKTLAMKIEKYRHDTELIVERILQDQYRDYVPNQASTQAEEKI